MIPGVRKENFRDGSGKDICRYITYCTSERKSFVVLKMDISEKPVILILGAGAVGLSLAGRLVRSCTVYAACRTCHAEKIHRQGLKMEGIWGDEVVHGITCISSPDMAPSHIDYLIITAKGTDTDRICREYAGALRGKTAISIQNGIGNEDVISRYAGQTIGGTIITNFSIRGNGYVRVQNESGPMMLGLWSGDNREILHQIITRIRNAGIPVEESPDIRAAKWEKSLLNIAVNPICALLSIPVGSSMDIHLRDIITNLIRETFQVMRSMDITLRWADADEYLDHLFNRQIPDFSNGYPSMYYDITGGKKTEIDILNGYIVRIGELNGIPTPYNRCITDLIRFQEEKSLIP